MKRKYESEDIVDRSTSGMIPIYSHSYPSTSSHHRMHGIQPVHLFQNTHASSVSRMQICEKTKSLVFSHL